MRNSLLTAVLGRLSVLLLNIGLLALALFGYTTFRHFSSRSTESLPCTENSTVSLFQLSSASMFAN
ncbi:hypothetical protein ACUOCP_23780, partial [Escherichia sp. R-CC3]